MNNDEKPHISIMDSNMVSLSYDKEQGAVFAVLTDNSLDAIRRIIAEELAKVKKNDNEQ